MRWPFSGKIDTVGSLRGQFLRWLLIPLVILVALNAFSVYRNALDAADLAYDRSLLSSARALAERVAIVDGKVVANVPYVALDSFETDTLGRLYYKVTGVNGEFVSGYEDLPGLPKNVPRSDIYPALVHFFHADYQGQPIRIAALLQPVYDDQMRGITLIEVGETLDARRGLSRTILIDTLLRQAALVLAVALMVWVAVRFVLHPLMQLKEQVETREPTDLSGFDANLVHKEIRPLINAMNGYMARLQTLISGQKRFIADASHQLRTPLTVLKTQAELALRENDAAAMRHIVQSIADTTDATVHLANRLLSLARTGYGAAEAAMDPVALNQVARQVCVELALPAVKKQIDMSLDADQDVVILGHELLLHEMISNLLDNAIRYTPEHGRIAMQVRMEGTAQLRCAVLEIEDSGPGIALSERDKVFEPFHRAASSSQMNPGGAGLGLSIVRDIVELHRGQLQLDAAARGSGLKLSVSIPLLPSSVHQTA
ncbi:sensor histidine kinase N-terminal domain-containing protein [Undibacterium sp. Jales W-56]|uniref:sensor histidine kinase n=1 Tax=Undibacterium sp. Jales W-56 TaxID=2897325 RepID=UPI0021D0495F|nr:sensor histidine kinase [Undibacterium sp. Jales W-56]MCU6434281.1 sensor histidine kinase N-terminal domain-containing protein [Undibacterium sp. Jales W-56]